MTVNSSPWTVPPLVLNGQRVVGEGGVIEVTNPATGQVICGVNGSSPGQVDAAVRSARAAFDDGRWSELTVDQRADSLIRASQVLEHHREEFIQSIVTEVGCPISTVRAGQVDLALQCFRWFAEAARRDRTRCLEPDMGVMPSESMIRLVPVGVVAAICAYNNPLVMGVIKVAPALAAGCTTVLMPSPLAPLTLMRFVELLHESGLPDGVVNMVVGQKDVGRALTEHAEVDKVTFTGSVGVGTEVMRQASTTLKGLVLELGGKSPAIVLPDADLELYVPSISPTLVAQCWARLPVANASTSAAAADGRLCGLKPACS